MAWQFATRIGAIRVNRFAEKKTSLITLEQFAQVASNLRFATFSAPNLRVPQKEVGKWTSITFSFLVTFRSLLSFFSSLFCQNLSAGLLLWLGDNRKEGVQFGDPRAIRADQPIRTNLRIDLRKSGHLSTWSFSQLSLAFSADFDKAPVNKF